MIMQSCVLKMYECIFFVTVYLLGSEFVTFLLIRSLLRKNEVRRTFPLYTQNRARVPRQANGRQMKKHLIYT